MPVTDVTVRHEVVVDRGGDPAEARLIAGEVTGALLAALAGDAAAPGG